MPTAAIDFIVFDLDGTLVDSLDDITTSVNAVFTAHRLAPLSKERVERIVGDGVTSLIRRALPEGNESLLTELIPDFMAHYRKHLLVSTRPYDGVVEALRENAGRYKMAVLTNKPVVMAEEILHGLCLRDVFGEVRGGDSFRTKKPDPLGLVAMMASAGVAPSRTLVVGDSRNDVATGRDAGALTCGVSWGYGAQGFAELPPDFTVDRFIDIFGRISPGSNG